MYNDKVLSFQNLESLNYVETKKNVNNFFLNLEKLAWQLAKENNQKGLTANYNFSAEYKKQPYVPIGKDAFKLSAKEHKEEQIKQYIANYYWAEKALTDKEQLYIREYFVNRKFEDEFIEMLGFNNIHSNEYINLKKSAIYKFADFLGLLIEKD